MAGVPCTATYEHGSESFKATFDVEPVIRELLKSSDESLCQNANDEVRKQAARHLQLFNRALMSVDFRRIRGGLHYSCDAA